MNFHITDTALQQLRNHYLNKYLRIKTKIRTWAGITYEMVQDEPREDDNVYKVNGITFIVNKEIEKDISHIEIDYKKEWWGEDYIITAGF